MTNLLHTILVRLRLGSTSYGLGVIEEVVLLSGPDILYFFSLLNVVEDNPARRGFSCKEGGVGVDMQHLERLSNVQRVYH